VGGGVGTGVVVATGVALGSIVGGGGVGVAVDEPLGVAVAPVGTGVLVGDAVGVPVGMGVDVGAVVCVAGGESVGTISGSHWTWSFEVCEPDNLAMVTVQTQP
jgi:hypothetical protein